MSYPKVKLESLSANDQYSFVGGPFGSKLTGRDYVKEGIPVIRGVNLNNGRYLSADDFVYVTETKVWQDLKSNLAKPLDIVFTQRGTLGQVAIIPNNYSFDFYVISQSQMKMTVDEKKADRLFLYYYFTNCDTVRRIKSHVSSSGVPHINLTVLRNFDIECPSLSIQKKIASILSNYDDLIENNRRRIQLLEESARLLYKEWFVHLRFPGHETTKIIDGVPEGWELKTLGLLAKINHKSLKKDFQGIIEYIDIASVSTGKVNGTTILNFTEAPSRARRIVSHGDIIWSCIRPNRKSFSVIWQPLQNLIVSTGFAVISPNQLVFTPFIYFSITTQKYVDYLSNVATGVAYPAVKPNDFKKSLLLIPTDRIIKTYSKLCFPIFEQIKIFQQQNQKLSEARDLLLPRLMNGEIEV